MNRILAMLVLVLFAAFNAAWAENDEARAKAQKAAKQLMEALKERLQSEIGAGGFARAVEVCSKDALKLTADIGGENGVELRRVTAKARNPKNVPDAYEQGALKTMEADLSAGTLKEAYEGVQGEGGTRYYRFMKPLRVGDLCLNCHGGEDALNKEAAEKIKKLYPDDKATGYAPGQLRGAVSVKVKL